jgi:hypothetical protein
MAVRKKKNARRGGRIGGRFSRARTKAREEEARFSLSPQAREEGARDEFA